MHDGRSPLASFDAWLGCNRHCFTHPPCDIAADAEHRKFHFTGIHRSISARVSLCGEIVIAVDHEGSCWDLIAVFDACAPIPADDGDGYVCGECEQDARVRFDTREELWAAHTFDPLLDWANEHFTDESNLWLFGEKGRWSSARISPSDALPKGESGRCLIASYPVCGG